MADDEYPEHEKMHAVMNDSHAIGEFLDTSGYTLAQWGKDECPECGDEIEMLMPVHRSIQQILADYFKIDLDKLDAEKRAMLEAIRSS